MGATNKDPEDIEAVRGLGRTQQEDTPRLGRTQQEDTPDWEGHSKKTHPDWEGHNKRTHPDWEGQHPAGSLLLRGSRRRTWSA